MDLVEIRKKANSQKKKSAKREPAAEDVRPQASPGEPSPKPKKPVAEDPQRPEVVETSAPENAASSEPETEHRSAAAEAAGAGAREMDPLDALFATRQENWLEISDNYLQALVASDEAADSNIEQWLTFTLGKEEYALSIESVSEIIKPREVTDIPRVPDFISGIISLRGIIVPIFDLNRRLNLGSAEISSASRIIVCNDGDRLAGFMVDRINQVVNVPIGNIEPPPTVLSGLDRDFVDGVGRVGNRMLILLHLSNVINAELV